MHRALFYTLLTTSVFLSSCFGDRYYFWNEVTGQRSWHDPGSVGFLDENGIRFWVDKAGNHVKIRPNNEEYVWQERFSEQHSRYYFINRVTNESTWKRPVDLSWRRVPTSSEL